MPLGKLLARCMVSLNPMCRHENRGGQGRVVPRTFILPSLNGEIFNEFHGTSPAAKCRRMTLLIRSVTISLAKTRHVADPASINGWCAKSTQKTRCLPPQKPAISVPSWYGIERCLPSGQVTSCHEQTTIGA